MRKRVFFSGTIIAIILLLSSSSAFAHSLKISDAEAQLIKTEIKEGAPIKDVLEKHNITLGQIKKALAGAGFKQGKRTISHAQIVSLTTKLGLDVKQVQEEIESGKTFKEILKEQNITQEQLRDAFQGEMKSRWDKESRK